MTVPFKLEREEAWTYRGLKLRFVAEMGDDLLHFRVERTGSLFQIEDRSGKRVPDGSWLVEALAAGDLKRPFDTAGLPFIRREASQYEYDPETAAELDPDVPIRRTILRVLDAEGASTMSDRALYQALIRIWADMPAKLRDARKIPAVRTVRQWLKHRGSEGDRPTHQLLSMSGRVKRARRLPLITVKLLHRAAEWYWQTPKQSITDAYARFGVALLNLSKRREREGSAPPLKLPSSEILRRGIRELESYERYAVKHGEKLAKQRFKANGRGLSATRFLQLGCMDHSQLGVFVIDGEAMLPLGKPWLTVLIDVYTRCILAFVLTWEPPSLYAALECVKRANRPKLLMRSRDPEFPVLALICGKCDEIVVDNGRELSGTSFQDIAGDVGISIRWAPAKEPTFKAVVERFFGTLNALLITKLPGSSLPAHVLRAMDYDPAKDAVLTLPELEDLIWRALSYYHIEEHSELNRPPASLWERDMIAYGISTIRDDGQLAKMAGAVKNGCQVTRSGVAIHGLQYHDLNGTSELLNDLIGLEPVRGQPKGSASVTVKVKYNPAELSEIHVWNRRRKRYVTLPCVDQAYSSGLTLWHHRQLRRWAHEKGLEFSSAEQRMRARAKLTEAILECVPDAKFRHRRSYARLLNSPAVEPTFSGEIELAFAEARHDGMAPVIEHTTLAANRTDGGLTSKRPRTKAKRTPGTKVSPKRTAPPPAAPRPESENDADPSTDWEGFEL